MPYSIAKTSLLVFAATNVLAHDSNQLVEPTSKDNSAGCNCYLVSGEDPGYFQYYRFWDFRNVPNDGSNDYTTAPALITTSENDGGQPATASFFNTTEWNSDWSIQDGPEESRAEAAVPSVNSYQNVFISRQTGSDGVDSTYLTLRASRPGDFASIAEIDSNQKNLVHSSIRARMRVIPYFTNDSIPYNDGSISINSIYGLNSSHPVAPGVVLGLFTYESDTEESDIEILTSDPTSNIRYSNQPDYDAKTGNTVPGASTDSILPNGAVWTDWHDHRIDWYDGVSRWYVDGELVLEKTLNVPKKPSGMVLNLWSDGGDWSGNMTVGAQVLAGIEWIEMTFNTSGKNPSKRHEKICSVGCSVDDVQNVGSPQVAFNTTGAEGGASGLTSTTARTLMVTLLLSSMMWLL